MIKFENGIFVKESVFTPKTLGALKKAFFRALQKCSKLQHKHGVHAQMENTVHHVLFFEKIGVSIILSSTDFFGTPARCQIRESK